MARYDLSSGHSPDIATSYATASIAPGAERLVLVFVVNGAEGAEDGAAPGVPSAAGNGLTWDRLGTATTGILGLGGPLGHRITCFRTKGPGAPGPLTFTFANRQAFCGWSVFEYDDVDVSGANGANAILQVLDYGGGTAGNLDVGLKAFGDPLHNLAVGGLALAYNSTNPSPVTPHWPYTEIHEVNVLDQFYFRATLQTQDHVGAPPTLGHAEIGWSWEPTTDHAVIVLELKAVAPPDGFEDIEFLARRFRPILFFHPEEAWFPSDAKRYIEHAALWRARPPLDQTKSWAGVMPAYPALPLVARGGLAGLDGEPGEFINDVAPSPAAGEERFLEFAGWKDEAGAPQPEVTETSRNLYADRGAIAARYAEPALSDSLFWHHAEVFLTPRLRDVARLVRAPDLAKLVDSLKDPILICYYLFFPAHEQPLPGCDNIEGKENSAFAGEWQCVAVLLERDGGDPAPRFIGCTGLGAGGVAAKRPAEAFDDAHRISMKVFPWRSGASPDLPGVVGNHPQLHVALGTHSLHLAPGVYKAEPYTPYEDVPQLCGRFDSGKLTPSDQLDQHADEDDSDFVLLKLLAPGLLGLGPWGLIAGAIWTVIEAIENFDMPDRQRVLPIPEDAPAAGSGKTLHPVGVVVPAAGPDTQAWRAQQGLEIDGRRYDFLVDRTVRAWWPDFRRSTGYLGRWGPRVQTDPLSRRAGMQFPDFWKMFLLAFADGKAKGRF